jgi:hypothetical protein
VGNIRTEGEMRLYENRAVKRIEGGKRKGVTEG